MKSNPLKIMTVWVLMLGLLLPQMGEAKSLPNKRKALSKDLMKCESEVKKLSSLGYPDKAEKQINKCNAIQGQLAKIEKGQQKVDRKLASLDHKKKAKKKASKKTKKHKKSKRHHVSSES